jgi:glucosamine 6-phosphate synthetase-like amidotransferase/phosphosugar isomerase protein
MARLSQVRVPGQSHIMAALAQATAVFMGKDVDQPRNLAKSVTVE